VVQAPPLTVVLAGLVAAVITVHDLARLAGAATGIGTAAAHALSLGWALATHDAREFQHVPGLRVEDWLS
jgi:predicted nucleic acid-binding protein